MASETNRELPFPPEGPHCKSFGRNGYYVTTGIEIQGSMSGDTFDVRGITGRNLPSTTYLQVPAVILPKLAAAFYELYHAYLMRNPHLVQKQIEAHQSQKRVHVSTMGQELIIDLGNQALDALSKGSWMEGNRPCGECSFVTPIKELDENGLCLRCSVAAEINRWEYDNEHPYFTIEDWRDDVQEGATVQGYHDWVETNVAQKRAELAQLYIDLRKESPEIITDEFYISSIAKQIQDIHFMIRLDQEEDPNRWLVKDIDDDHLYMGAELHEALEVYEQQRRVGMPIRLMCCYEDDSDHTNVTEWEYQMIDNQPEQYEGGPGVDYDPRC